MAAELAIALPAVLLVLMLGVGTLGAAARQVLLQDATADAARLLGRGDSSTRAFAAVHDVVDGATVGSSVQGDLVCVTARLDLRIGRLIAVPLRASSCALADSRLPAPGQPVAPAAP
ncbi:MAG: TadE family type IV pilus minor pilin [Microbacterium sp.]